MGNLSDISKVRDYWDRRPCNIRHSAKEPGTLEWSQEIMNRKYFVEPHIPGFAEFERWHGKKVLELGCGIGTDTINFAMHGAKVWAVDISRVSLEIAKKRAELHGVADRINFCQGNIETFRAYEYFDLIYSFGVIHHTPDPLRVLSGIQSVSHPRTILKMMVYHRYSTKVLSILLREKSFLDIDRAVAKHSEAQTGCPVTYTYTKKSVERLLDGFEIINKKVCHIFPYRVEDYTQYRYVKNWWWRWMPNRMFRAMESLFGWHLCIEARRNI